MTGRQHVPVSPEQPVDFQPAWCDPARQIEDLTVIAEMLSRAIAENVGATIGPLTVASRERYPHDAARGIFFRSKPLGDYAAGEFQFAPRSAIGCRWSYSFLKEDVVAAAANFTTSRERLRDMIEEAQRVTEEAIALGTPAFAQPSIRAIGARYRSPGKSERIWVELEVLGEDLTPGPEQFAPKDWETLADILKAPLAYHTRLANMLASNRIDGVLGRIDGVARRLIDDAGIDQESLLALLAMRREVTFHYGGLKEGGWDAVGLSDDWRDGTVGTILWHEGVLRGEFKDLTNDISLQEGTLTVKADWPATLVNAAVGESIGRFVEHPLLPAEAIIIGANQASDAEMVELRLVTPTTAMPMSA